MKENIRAKLLGLCRRLEELDAMLAAPDAADDMKRFTELSRERAEIEPVVLKTKEYEQTLEDIATAEEMAKDPEVAEFAREEMLAGKKKLEELEQDLQILLLPRDPDDNKNTFLEIRAGTGGEESALFAGDLLRMYMRYAERSGWRVEIVSKSDSDLGGYREVICRIIGEGAYSRLKFESGGHRVQRVPETEAQGRVHTSACTVAVMPEADEVEAVKINPQDLRIDVYRASGAGGQHVNKTESAIRITHLPTGTVVECQDERSQYKYKDRAMKILRSKLYEAQQEKQNAAIAAMEQNIRQYEAENKTGNPVLDTLLTAKSLYCQQHHITMTCVADGHLLDFLETGEICTIVGTALDNATESVETEPDHEKRLIRVAVYAQNGFVMLRFENYCAQEVELGADGLPRRNTHGG